VASLRAGKGRGFGDLSEYLDALRSAGELRVVTAPVDARLEVAEIHRRVIAVSGPALLIERVIGSDFPLVTNLFGTKGRVELAFGSRPRRTVERVVDRVLSGRRRGDGRLGPGAPELIVTVILPGLRP
jgi:3-polyprenyl-4-hydroxybenzoate decarboxylase